MKGLAEIGEGENAMFIGGFVVDSGTLEEEYVDRPGEMHTASSWLIEQARSADSDTQPPVATN